MNVSSVEPPVWPHWTTSPKSLRHWTTTMARGKGQRGNTVHHGALFTLSDSGESLDMEIGATFTSASLIEIDRKIRHSPAVVRMLEHYGNEILKQVGTDDFELVVSTKGKERPRCFVIPKSSKGIRAELSEAVLTKAAMSLASHRA
jgi:hypothetical protein